MVMMVRRVIVTLVKPMRIVDEDDDEDVDANQPELVLGDRSVLLKLGFSHI